MTAVRVFLERRLSLLAGLSAATVLGGLVWQRPFFGLMDDHRFLKYAAIFHDSGFWPNAWEYFKSDLAWGMFRPTLPFMLYGLYWTTGETPLVLFTLNFFLSFAALLGLAGALEAVMRHRSRILDGCSREQVVAATLLGALLFPWTHDLFLHPSLQEKVVMLAGALNLYWFGIRAERTTGMRFFATAAALLSVGFSTKAQFTMFVPAIVVFLWPKVPPVRWARPLFALAVSGAWLVFIRWLASRSDYTSQFGLARLVQNLVSPKAGTLMAFAALALALAWRNSPPRAWRERAVAAFPAWIIGGYLAVFVQWAIVGYLLASISAVLAFILAIALLKMPLRVRGAALALLVVGSLAVSAHRSYHFFGRLHDLRTILESPALANIAREAGSVVYVSCPEAAVAMRYYARRFQGYEMSFLATIDRKPGAHDYYLGDAKLCPLEASGHEILVPAGRVGGFQLFK